MTRQSILDSLMLLFARNVIAFVNSLPKTITNVKIARQPVRSVGSVGANYIEANESLGRKDFLMKIRISRKESKESRYWLQLMVCDSAPRATQEKLIQESTELMKIFEAILRNSIG